MLNRFCHWLVAPLIKETQIMTAALERLTASIQHNSDLTASAVALIGTLSQEIRTGVLNDDRAALLALADGLDAKDAELAAALVANTPGQPTAPGSRSSSGLARKTSGRPSSRCTTACRPDLPATVVRGIRVAACRTAPGF